MYCLASHFFPSIVKEPNKNDGKKLVRVINYLQATKDNIASMRAINTLTIKWYVNSSFPIHKDIRIHKNTIITLVNVAIISDSIKQKVKARNFTKSEMVTADNTISKIIWSKGFIEA